MYMTAEKKTILIISHDKIGDNMAGPGIRYHHMANFLSKDFHVTVGFFDPTYLPDDKFSRSYDIAHVDVPKFREQFNNKDIIISMWLGDEMMEYCKENGIFVTFDMYAPVPVENLSLYLFSGDPITANTDYSYRQSYCLYEKFFQCGDLFLLSNRRQLDYWMGYVFGTSQISVSGYKKRPLFDRFILAPMGIDSSQELKHTKSVMRGEIPGINQDDKVILWTGGIWNWFDAQTLIRAMGILKPKRPDIKLVFFGVKHPNPDVPAMQEASDTIALARRLELLNETVFVHEDWVPYHDRLNYLLEADAAVNTTKDTIESEMSHRTRVLDHLLATLPTIATSGDYLSDEVIKPKDLGIVVPPNDADRLAESIIEIVDDNNNKRIRKNISEIRAEYDWSQTLYDLKMMLLSGVDKLPFNEPIKPRDIPKDKLYFKIAKKIIPAPVKKILIRTFRYGR
jgi:glycosyltransferase involved in cell wall biosynthesis